MMSSVHIVLQVEGFWCLRYMMSYDLTLKKSPQIKWDSDRGSSALEADALTTRPTRRYWKEDSSAEYTSVEKCLVIVFFFCICLESIYIFLHIYGSLSCVCFPSVPSVETGCCQCSW